VSSALGGWIAGALSDRIGRIRTLQLTILWFAGFTFLCAFAQTLCPMRYALCACRLLSGHCVSEVIICIA